MGEGEEELSVDVMERFRAMVNKGNQVQVSFRLKLIQELNKLVRELYKLIQETNLKTDSGTLKADSEHSHVMSSLSP